MGRLPKSKPLHKKVKENKTAKMDPPNTSCSVSILYYNIDIAIVYNKYPVLLYDDMHVQCMKVFINNHKTYTFIAINTINSTLFKWIDVDFSMHPYLLTEI